MGTAMSFASKVFGLELAVYMVKISYEQKPYRRSLIANLGRSGYSIAKYVDQSRT
jgi:tryptophan synthase beta chain